MKHKGFSLIELIITILIIAILSVSLAPNVVQWVRTARRSKDIQTASAIARAVDIAFVVNPEAYATYQAWNKVGVNVSATVDGMVEKYKVYLVMANEAPTYCFKGGERTFGNKDGSTGFYAAVNKELGLSITDVNHSIAPKYKTKRDGAGPKAGYSYEDVDRWRIVKRADNGQMEIWSAQPNPYGGYPVYRVWPVADDVYR